jgi:hypothetical protein
LYLFPISPLISYNDVTNNILMIKILISYFSICIPYSFVAYVWHLWDRIIYVRYVPIVSSFGSFCCCSFFSFAILVWIEASCWTQFCKTIIEETLSILLLLDYTPRRLVVCYWFFYLNILFRFQGNFHMNYYQCFSEQKANGKSRLCC